MAETGLVNLSLEISDVHRFVEAFKVMSAAATNTSDDVQKAINSISDSLKNSVKELNGLENALKSIGTSISTTNFNDLSQQIEQFKALAEILGQATKNVDIFKGATVSISSSLDATTLTNETQKLVDTLKQLEIPETVIEQSKQLKEALTSGFDSICEKMDRMIDLLNGIQVNTSETTSAIRNLGIAVRESDVQLENNNNAMVRQTGIVRGLIERFKELFNWRRRNNEENQRASQQQVRRTTDNSSSSSQGEMGMFNNKTIQEGLNYLKWTVKRVAYFAFVEGVKDAFKNVPKIGQQYEKITSTLSVNFGGDIKLARAQFAELNDVINKIPQSLDECVNVTKTLANFNFRTTQKDLIAIAKIAEGTGESFEGIADSMGRFAEGSMKALKRIGISAKDNGDSITMSFRGVDTEIQKNTGALQEYINTIAESQFGSALDEQMNGLTGTFKRLGNAWDDLSLALYQGGIGDAIKTFVDSGIKQLQLAIGWLNNPKTQKAISGMAHSISSILGLVGNLFRSVSGLIKTLFDGIGIAWSGLCTVISKSLSLLTLGFVDFFNFTDAKFEDWIGAFELAIEQISYGIKRANEWFMGNAEQEALNKKANEVTQSIIDEKGLDALNKRLKAKYPDGFIDKTFFFGDKTVIQNESEIITKRLDAIDKTLSKSYLALDKTTNETQRKVIETCIKRLKEEKEELIKFNDQLVAVFTDERYINSLNGDVKVTPTTFRENADNVIKKRLKDQEEFEKKQKELQDAIDKVLKQGKYAEKNDGKPIGSGSNGGTGGGKELKNWEEFYRRQLAQLTEYGKEKLQLENQLTETLKDIEETYQNADVKNVEQYNELKLKAQEKYEKDLENLLENQANSVRRLFNRDYDNQLLDLDKNLKDRSDSIKNAFANMAITQEEFNQLMVENEKKYQEELIRMREENWALIQLYDDSDIISLQNSYDKKLEMLESFHEKQLISEEFYQQRRVELIDQYNEKSAEISNRQKKEKLDKQNEPYKKMAEGLGDLSNAFENLTQNMDKSSGAYKALFAVQKGFAIASATMNAIVAWTEALKGPHANWYEGLAKYAQAVALTTSIIGQLKSVSMYDKGGRIPSGEVGIVGEIGPELIRGPATVTSRKDTADLLGNGNSNVTVNIIEDASKAGNVDKQTTDEETIINVCVSNIYRGGELASSISNVYGLSRVGI